jgi:hypothetical protein
MLKETPIPKKISKGSSPPGFPVTDMAVAEALGQIAPETPLADQAVTVLTDLLEFEWPDIRMGAFRALRQFGPKAAVAIPKVRALQNDKDSEVKQGAAATLKAIEANTDH